MLFSIVPFDLVFNACFEFTLDFYLESKIFEAKKFSKFPLRNGKFMACRLFWMNNAQQLGALARFMIMISFLDPVLALLWPTAW